jgi:pyrimidine-nucleoside phosphorylase
MNISDILAKKRDGSALSADEIRFFVDGYTAGAIADYQMSALLMAIEIRGMAGDETTALTRAMLLSGEVMDFSDIPGVKVDKHSTGGVGDGISLALAPLVASCGAVVPMMSGRCLGHTGGTLDKLESIPGFRVCLTPAECRKQLANIGVALFGQTETVAPADKKIYALRDVTATVESIALISASIMSKKLAEGCDALLLDVKTGSGAFMKNKDDARLLAQTMLSLGKSCGKKMAALITDMNQPLGNAVGNSLEVSQAIDILNGKGPADAAALTMELGARMLLLSGIARDTRSAKSMLEDALKKGRAREKFREIIEAQGGDVRVLDDPLKVLPHAKYTKDACAEKTGYVASIDTRAVGMASVLLSAGRLKKEDTIDPGAGIIVRKKIGDHVEAGEPLAVLHYSNDRNLVEAKQMLNGAYMIGDTRPELPPLIHEELQKF